MFKRILVANRGEIALRVIRLAANWGSKRWPSSAKPTAARIISTLADEAYCVGTAKAADSYLRIDRVISAAEIGNVQAIHPGYGFLSENAHFNEVCRTCNIDFIGPTPEAMSRLGDKNEARRLAREAGVPVVPGSEGLIRNEAEAVRLAHQIGFPVLIKATAGGGGRGMRVAANDLVLKTAIQQASAEAEAAFGNAGIYLERYIERPRHVEVQFIADHHGNVVHLWERDCSVQRRHQKLIEESPSPALAAGDAHRDVRSGRPPGPHRRLHECRHLRIHRRSDRQFFLHRSECPDPGRASRDGNGHGHRLDQGPNPRRRRRAAAVEARRRPGPRSRHRMPDQRRRPARAIFSPRRDGSNG